MPSSLCFMVYHEEAVPDIQYVAYSFVFLFMISCHRIFSIFLTAVFSKFFKISDSNTS